MARCENLTRQYWGEPVIPADYIQSCLPTQTTKTISFQISFDKIFMFFDVKLLCISWWDNESVAYAEGSKDYGLLDRGNWMDLTRDITFVKAFQDDHGEQKTSCPEFNQSNLQQDILLQI